MLVGFVGRLHRQKGCGFFIRAAAIVREWAKSAASAASVAAASSLGDESRTKEDLPPRVEFVVVGDGPQSRLLRSLAQRLGAGVRFTGFKEGRELRCYYRRMDLFVFPSLFPESFGMVNVEAMLYEVGICVGGCVGVSVGGWVDGSGDTGDVCVWVGGCI